MVDPKFGTKRVCEACGGKFYDLNKNPLVCPLCGHSFDPNAASTPVAPVAKVAPVQEPHEKDDDETPKDENEISLDDIVEQLGTTACVRLTTGVVAMLHRSLEDERRPHQPIEEHLRRQHQWGDSVAVQQCIYHSIIQFYQASHKPCQQ